MCGVRVQFILATASGIGSVRGRGRVCLWIDAGAPPGAGLSRRCDQRCTPLHPPSPSHCALSSPGPRSKGCPALALASQERLAVDLSRPRFPVLFPHHALTRARPHDRYPAVLTHAAPASPDLSSSHSHSAFSSRPHPVITVLRRPDGDVALYPTLACARAMVSSCALGFVCRANHRRAVRIHKRHRTRVVGPEPRARALQRPTLLRPH